MAASQGQRDHPVIVETDGGDTEVRDILLRTGAKQLEERETGTMATPTQVPREGLAEGHERQPAEQHPHGGNWLREIVFGLNDGLVTTLVFIMVASAIAQSHTTLLLIVVSEVMAGGVSMALGGYLAARTERDVLAHQIETERQEIQQEPEEERAELRAIYRRKGLSGPLLDHVVAHQTANDERWLRALVHDELGIMGDIEVRPWRQGAQIGLSFVLGGIIPALPVIVGLQGHWMQGVAYVLTAATAMILGSVKARYSTRGPLRNGLEFLAIVTGGTLAGVVIGILLHAA